MKAQDVAVGTEIQLSTGEKAAVIYNQSLQGDEVIVYEIYNGAVGVVNINDVEIEK